MKKTSKLLIVLALVVLLLCSLTIKSQAAETKYFTMNNVSSEVGQKARVEIKAKTDLSLDDINMEVFYDTTKLSVTANDLKVADILANDADFAIRDNVIVLGYAVTDAITIKAGTVLLTIDFTVLSKGVGVSQVTASIDAAKTIVAEDGTPIMDEKKEDVTSQVTGIQPVTGITLNKTTGTLNVGQAEDLTATVEPSTATNKNVTWSSSDIAVATVNNGKVTAVAPGTAVITAKAGSKTATYTLTVKAPLKGITLSKSEISVVKGQSQTLSVTYNPANTTDSKEVQWSSDNKTVATVENGIVKGIKAGTATITAKVGNYTQKCVVTVKEIALNEIAIDQKDFELNVDETKTLKIIYNPANTTDDRTAKWSSSDDTVATVENGVVKGIKAGTATITVTVNGKTASVEVTIKEKPVEESKEENKEENNGIENTNTENKEQENVASKKEEESVLPKTGDIAIGIFVALVVVSGAGILFILKRNKKMSK